mmetsp:Transcript_35932/g.114221  ORF Transcript_35932/g.114221 Transcript_35932/m.114221 type:complete len:168 (+) Transcript_35932:1220-1723(+)
MAQGPGSARGVPAAAASASAAAGALGTVVLGGSVVTTATDWVAVLVVGCAAGTTGVGFGCVAGAGGVVTAGWVTGGIAWVVIAGAKVVATGAKVVGVVAAGAMVMGMGAGVVRVLVIGAGVVAGLTVVGGGGVATLQLHGVCRCAGSQEFTWPGVQLGLHSAQPGSL